MWMVRIHELNEEIQRCPFPIGGLIEGLKTTFFYNREMMIDGIPVTPKTIFTKRIQKDIAEDGISLDDMGHFGEF